MIRHPTLLTLMVAAGFGTTLTSCGREPSLDDFTALADEFVAAGIVGDREQIAVRAADSLPVTRILTVRRLEPELLEAARGHLKVTGANVKPDTVRLFFGFSYGGETEHMALGFLRREDRWLVYHLGFPDRQ